MHTHSVIHDKLEAGLEYKKLADEEEEKRAETREKLEEKVKKTGFFKRLVVYNTPYFLIPIAIFASACQGVVMPLYGWFYTKLIFSTFMLELPEEQGGHDMGPVKKWTLFIVMIGCIALVATYTYKVLFGVLRENMTLQVRK